MRQCCRIMMCCVVACLDGVLTSEDGDNQRSRCGAGSTEVLEQSSGSAIWCFADRAPQILCDRHSNFLLAFSNFLQFLASRCSRLFVPWGVVCAVQLPVEFAPPFLQFIRPSSNVIYRSSKLSVHLLIDPSTAIECRRRCILLLTTTRRESQSF